jgi:putative acetyltransferase
MKLVIRRLKKSEKIRELLEFINELVKEDAYIRLNKKLTYKEEKKWLEDNIKSMKKGDSIILVAELEGKIIGTADASRGKGRERGNVGIGISIRKEYRGKGFGKKLLKEIIFRAKKELKPKNIYLEVYVPNKVAISLYKQLGFRKVARLKSWGKYKNKYVDTLLMVLRKT